MSIFIIIAGIVCFIHFTNRISTLENKIKQFERPPASHENIVVAAQSKEHGSTEASSTTTDVEKLFIQDQVPHAVPSPVVSPALAQVSESNETTEFALGAKVLTTVGIVALFLGVAFFLRFAFENNIITESMRVFLGILLGLIMGGIGHVLRKKYVAYGSGLVGGGCGVLYISIFAAYSSYSLVSLPIAFLLLCAVTIGSITMALAYDSMALITYSFVGAYIMPLLLPLSNSVHTFFLYLVALNIGVLLIARKKVWPELTVGSLIGTCLLAIKWLVQDDAQIFAFETHAYLILLFFVFFMTSLINFVKRDRDYKGIDGFLIYAIPIFYYILNLPLFEEKESVSLFTLSLGIFYIGTAVLIRTILATVGEIKRFTNVMFVIAGAFIAGSIALYFDGDSVTLLWALQAIVMLVIGHVLNSKENRIGAMTVALFSAIKLILTESGIASEASVVFNERTLLFFFVTCAFAALWFYYTQFQKKDVLSKDEEQAGRYLGGLGLTVLTFAWVNLEAYHAIPTYTSLYLSLIWILYSVFAISVSFVLKEKIFRVCSYIISMLTVLIIVGALYKLPQGYYEPILNIRIITVVAFVVLSMYVVWLFKHYKADVSSDESNLKVPILVAANGLLFWAVSLEVLTYFNMKISESYSQDLSSQAIISSLENTKRVILSAVWLAYAVVGLGVGIVYRSAFARHLAIWLFGITIFKIFLYDTSNLSDVYRFVSFILLGVILLLVGFAYYRFKDRITKFVKIEDPK